MKCKTERSKSKNLEKLRNDFFSELEKRNPKRVFSIKGNSIYVDTHELWKLNLPENSIITSDKNKEGASSLGYISIEFGKGSHIFVFGY